MSFGRTSGILLHPTSLPGPHGVGELGAPARDFVDFLAGAGQGLWQVLPLGPTGYGDSPYQCFSAFAGNPLLISLDRLVEQGLLEAKDLATVPAFPSNEVDYGPVIEWKYPLLRKAHQAFASSASAAQKREFEEFCRAQAAWLDDYALYRMLKDEHGGKAWTTWEPAVRDREGAALARRARAHAVQVEAQKFWQFEFFAQWQAIRDHAHERGIHIMGDIPIFVSQDSSDVWSNRPQFRLKASGEPEVVAGVPPDYFSATGQLWGNPLYAWEAMKADGFRWWIDRFRATLRLYDWVRLDHFRGFEAFWEIPGGEKTAVNGKWVKAPGAELFAALQKEFGSLPIVAENLGVITPEVEALREQYGFPGMAILQFAFGSDSQANSFIPHNYPRNRVVYTGTHDNDTTVGWWTAGVGDSTRSAEDVRRERDFAAAYLGSDGHDIHWAFIRAVLASVADLAIVPAQDLLGLGSEARMNLPGRPGGNWKWRMAAGALTPALQERLGKLTRIYGRAAPPPAGKRAARGKAPAAP